MNIDKRNSSSTLDCFPFNSDRITFFYSGRNAVWHGMNVLGLSSDDEILVPSYNCGAEIDPVFKLRLKIKLFRIDSGLNIDFNDLKSKINRNTKAILVTHYFGFPQPVERIRAICDEHNMFLIEDCAHALFSTYKGRPLGSSGDISIFSFRKTIPIPDGGALVINGNRLKYSGSRILPPLTRELYNFANMLLFDRQSRMIAMLPNLISEIKRRWGKENPQDSLHGYEAESKAHDYFLDVGSIQWGMTRLSAYLLKKEDVGVIIRRNRDNFNFLLQKLVDLSGIHPVFDELPEGVCPSLFPAVVNERDRLWEALLTKGIFTFKTWPFFYPSLPWASYPDAVFLKNNILSFPIHHRISGKDLLKAVRCLRNISNGSAAWKQ